MFPQTDNLVADPDQLILDNVTGTPVIVEKPQSLMSTIKDVNNQESNPESGDNSSKT